MKNDEGREIVAALSYPIDVSTLPAKGVTVRFDANEKECTQLAENHGLLNVLSFLAEFHVGRWKKRGVKIKGTITAKIIQECVITLEPLTDCIKETVDTVLVPADSHLAKPKFYDETGELFVDAEGPDAPEVFEGNMIEVGELAEEFFELAINPYPRKSDAVLPQFGIEPEEKKDIVRPFDALKKLKDL